MKKTLRFLFTLLLVTVGSNAWADAAYTLTFSSTTNQSSISNYTSTWNAVIGDMTWSLTNFNNNKNAWSYVKCGRKKNASVGTITNTVAMAKKIGSVVVTIDAVTASSVNSIKLEVSSASDFSSVSETVTASSIATGDMTFDVTTPIENGYYRLTFDCASASSNGVVQISKVVYNEYVEGAVTAPTISGTTPFSGSTEVTITVPDGTTVYYTTDGNDPDDREGTEYTAPFTISATTTVKAMAYNNEGSGSSIASKVFVKTEHAGTQTDPYTVADVLAIYEGGTLPSDNVYVKGIISQIDDVSTSYGNATYYISDDGTKTNQYEIFRGKYLNNEAFSSADQIAVGGTVVVYGQIILYNNKTQEMTQGNYIVEYTAPALQIPTISGETSFLESTTVTITAANSTAIHYTTDGTDPTTSSTQYSAPFTLTETTTVKAIAVYAGGTSDVASQTFTKQTIYTVAEAEQKMTDAASTASETVETGVYVKGIVSQIRRAYSYTSGGYDINYYISDDGTTTNQLYVYYGFSNDAANTGFLTQNYSLEVGDEVIVYGNLYNYVGSSSTTQEITNNHLYKHTTPITVGETGYATAYYSGKALTVPEGLTATTYKVQSGTNTLAESKVYNAGEVIPVGEAVVLHGTAGSYSFVTNSSVNANTTVDTGNELKGTDAETALTADATKYFYELSLNANKEAGSVGFYWANDDGIAFTNGAHKAYLTRTKDTTAAKISAYLLNGGTVTGINDINAEEKAYDGAIYNVAGQRVNKDYKGVVIINGKKIIKK